MIRVVADTNTVLSDFLWTGPPSQIIQLAEKERIQLVSSNELIDELVDVLTRRKFTKRLEEIVKTPEAFIANYRALVELVEPGPLALPVSDDPDDDAVLACAVIGKVEYIVTGDGDLLRLNEYAGISIRTVVQFLSNLIDNP